MLFIDANQYLGLYIASAKRLKPLLRSLLKHKAHIFVTRQIVDEVHRNKLSYTQKHLAAQIETLRDACRLHPEFKQTLKKAQEEALDLLRAISASEDEISKSLDGIFATAVDATDTERGQARHRKECGNPPGKPNQPLGDQLSWEQLLSHSKGKIWIVSSDGDFSTKHGAKRFLNPLLYQDLKTANGRKPVTAFCFDNLMEAIQHFVKESGLSKAGLPTIEEVKRIDRVLQEASDFVQTLNRKAAMFNCATQNY